MVVCLLVPRETSAVHNRAIAGVRILSLPRKLAAYASTALEAGLRAISFAVLMLCFLLVITPVALVFRAFGRDPLRLRHTSESTFWRRREQIIHPHRNASEFLKSGFVVDFWAFLRVRKKLWLLPIILVLVAFGGLMVLAEGAALAPFIYSLF